MKWTPRLQPVMSGVVMLITTHSAGGGPGVRPQYITLLPVCTRASGSAVTGDGRPLASERDHFRLRSCERSSPRHLSPAGPGSQPSPTPIRDLNLARRGSSCRFRTASSAHPTHRPSGCQRESQHRLHPKGSTQGDPAVARRAFRQWCQLAEESGIRALQAFARRLRPYEQGILNHCRYPLHTGRLEGINNKIKVIKRQAYGFRDDDYFILKIKGAFPGPLHPNTR